MRLLRKLAMKLTMMVIMVVLMGGVLRVARPYIMKAAGMPEGMPGGEGLGDVHFSSVESVSMATVFKSALRLFSGTAKRAELAGELSDKLYAGRADAGTMSELGIELVKPGASPSAPAGGAGTAKPPAKSGARAGASPAATVSSHDRDVRLAQVWRKAVANPELALVPVVLLGMAVVYCVRRRPRMIGPMFCS